MWLACRVTVLVGVLRLKSGLDFAVETSNCEQVAIRKRCGLT